MPRRHGSSRYSGADSDSDSEDEPQPGPSRATQATPKKSTQRKGEKDRQESFQDTNFKKDIVTKMAGDLVFYVLTQERKRAPLKRVDMFKSVGLNKRPKDEQEETFDKCRRTLKSTFGLELVENDEKKGIYFAINT